MTRRLWGNSRFPGFLSVALILVLGLFLLPIAAMAGSQAAQQNCRQSMTSSGIGEAPLVVSMKDLQKDPESYYGKTITVDGELHRTFTDNVFTIEDDGFFFDRDVLVISTVPMTDAVIPLDDSLEPGKDVRVTGVVQPYDRGKLECAYGPLQLESREGHSFTKNPVLIVAPVAEAAAEPDIKMEKPTFIAPEPAAETPVEEPATPAAPEEPAAEPEPAPAKLPTTAGHLPLMALAGVLAIGASIVRSRFRR